MTSDEDRVFNLMMKKYGMWDYTKFMYGKKGLKDEDTGYYRWAAYHDGGWLEGYYLQPVIYWGA